MPPGECIYKSFGRLLAPLSLKCLQRRQTELLFFKMYYSIVLVALLNVKVSSAVQGQRSEPVHRLDVHFYRSRDHATEADA